MINIIKPIIPELTLAAGICLMVLVNSFIRTPHRSTSQILAVLTLVIATATAVPLFNHDVEILFNGQFIIDPLAIGLKISAYVAVLLVVLSTTINEKINQSEILLIELFATLGISIICSAANLLTIYLGLETLALSLYGLVAANKNSIESTEAAMKFFILGAIASAIFLYGISLIYGIYGTLNINLLNVMIVNNTLELKIAVGFILCGIAFKFGAIPFHSWVPDTYQGASTPVALFISTAPKIAAFALLYRLLIDAFISISETWVVMIYALGMISLIIGNLIAISQNNFKRLLGYSAIGHIGFIFLGIATGTKDGLESSLFYLLIYVLMTMVAFMVIEVLSSKHREVKLLKDFKDLNSSHPWLSLIMLFTMCSMIGIPPFAGFYAKWSVLSSLVAADMVYTAIIAILMTVVAAFYYLRVIWFIYFEKTNQEIGQLESTILQKAVVSFTGIAILLIGLYPKPVLDFCRQIISSNLLLD